MAGPKLEIFKACYLLAPHTLLSARWTHVHFNSLRLDCSPVMFMLYFGAPEFYDKNVRGSKFWPAQEQVNTRTGIERKELLYEVERLKQERIARKAAREGLADDKNL
ncbi:hypothetical protein BGZ65_004713 [Modicella reniformis]|uniref:Uncharacterized protein n=1 Tax=Modicella reniformis TaxID=1440133 RepID=A0A9P6IYD6_9FUNG|nr:hypothetical protein BGZ65_004713 [Modicella reniformis]